MDNEYKGTTGVIKVINVKNVIFNTVMIESTIFKNHNDNNIKNVNIVKNNIITIL